MLVCMIPRPVLGLEPERVARMTATRIGGDDGIAWALAPFLERLADLAIRGEVPGAHDRVVESVVDLVESLCASVIESDRMPPILDASRARPARARVCEGASRRSRHWHPATSQPRCTSRTRYLHRLFEDEGSTVSGWIRQRRLEGCRRDLADPSRCDETVTSIGSRWGLTNSAHLSRLFREAYGVSPTEYRAEQQHLADAVSVVR